MRNTNSHASGAEGAANLIRKRGQNIMCANMEEFKAISKMFFKLEQEKAKKKKELDTLEGKIKQLKSEISSYMKKRQKKELIAAEFIVLFTPFTKPIFDKDAFIAGEEDGEETYKKYLRDISMERVTVKLSKRPL